MLPSFGPKLLDMLALDCCYRFESVSSIIKRTFIIQFHYNCTILQNLRLGSVDCCALVSNDRFFHIRYCEQCWKAWLGFLKRAMSLDGVIFRDHKCHVLQYETRQFSLLCSVYEGAGDGRLREKVVVTVGNEKDVKKRVSHRSRSEAIRGRNVAVKKPLQTYRQGKSHHCSLCVIGGEKQTSVSPPHKRF